ncbi:WD40-repeat-containing domain protein [Naematelia encephala]|uniref:WD40-repeat-containing domain protein n=1 Tax=Naematelia encephala TaxID=71784 RepID=A0A1Y2AW93_9TREE|nr:WD40-repeat-containing domain protein [Naematelia encephala]
MPVPRPAPTTVPLHRVRFYDRTPSPITALAFPPLPLPAPVNPSQAKGKQKDEGVSDDSILFSNGGEKGEFGPLVVARENGEVELWEYERDYDQAYGYGNWVLQKVLPPTLTHPSISLIALVIRNVEDFHNKAYSVPRIEDVRLFTSASDSNDIVERCLFTGRILMTYPIPSPPLWTMSVSPTQSLLCLATTSPSLHFLTITATSLEIPPPHLLRSETLPNKTRTVSLAWGPPSLEEVTEGEYEWRDTYLVTGNSDSSFRKWEIPAPNDGSKSGGVGRVTIKGRSVLDKVKKNGKGKGTIVWGVGVLPNHTIITSDSLGSVTFWDGASMAQRQSFRAHKADAMCMVIGPDARSIYTSGPDQRIVQFTPSGPSTWALTSTRRVHSHDVRALAMFPPYLPLATSHPLSPPPINPLFCPVIASGGWDMHLALTPAATPESYTEKLRNPLGKAKGLSRLLFDEAYPRKMGFLNGGRGNGVVAFGVGARLVLGKKERGVGIWRIMEGENGWEKVLEMDFKLRTNITAAAISDNGGWLAVSDLYETKLFRLEEDDDGKIRPQRVRSFLDTLISSPQLSHLSIPSRGCGASSLIFTADCNRLVAGLVSSGEVLVLELPSEARRDVEVVKCFQRKDGLVDGRVVKHLKGMNGDSAPNGTPKVNGKANGGSNGHAMDVDSEEEAEEPATSTKTPAWVTSLAASDDGQWLALGDLAGRVVIINLDTLQQHATLPTFPSAPVSLSFTPCHPSLVLIVHPTSVTFYHLDTRRLLTPSYQVEVLNTQIRAHHTPVESATFEPDRRSVRCARLVVWAHDWLITARLDLEQISRSVYTSKRPEDPRQKRARQAREQKNELVSSSTSPSISIGESSPSTSTSTTTSSSMKDPEFVKVWNEKFRSVIGVGWLGQEELVVVERPIADFSVDLPAVFVHGRFGRS